MLVQCSECKSGNLIDDEELAGVAQLRVRCATCRAFFVVDVPKKTVPTEPTDISKTEKQDTKTAAGAHLKLPMGKTVSLVVMQGALKGEVFRLSKPQVSIGRSAADVVINDPEISASHCVLEVREEVAELRDTGSTNGTFVDGEQIERHQLKHLSEFRIGGTTLMFVVTKFQ